MARIPKKTIDRFVKGSSKFKRILKSARDRDLNESDTVSIVKDMLEEVFGYDKYTELTSEFAIRGTYCDVAIKIGQDIRFLIEVKAIGIALKDNHLRQVVDYGAKEGVQWVVLTNGMHWEVYRLKFERPISYDLVASIDFQTINARKYEDQEKLFLLSREALGKSVRDSVYKRVQSVNRFTVAAMVLSDPVLAVIRRDLRKLSPGLKVQHADIEKILRNEVLKRDAIEAEEADKATKDIHKLNKKGKKHAKRTTSNAEAKGSEITSESEPKRSADSSGGSEPMA